MNNSRKIYLDNIRWITVVIVVVYHVIYMFNGVQTAGVIGPFSEVQYQDAFQYITYPWFMALLFVVSGMSSKFYLDNHTTKDFCRDRTRKLLVPSTIGLFVFQWITGYFNMKIGGAFETMSAAPKPVFILIMVVSGIGVLWYIQVLWIFSVLLILIKKIDKDRLLKLGAKTPVWLIILFAVVLYGAAQILNTPIITVYRFGIYGFSFFVGYFCFSHDEVMDRILGLSPLFDVMAIGLGIAYTVIYFGESYAVEPYINNICACTFCWFAILGILTTMRKYADKSNALSVWMSRKSWGLYVFHYLPLAAVAYFLHNKVPGMPAIFVYLIVAVAAFAGGYALNEIISRIPVIRWCVLGIKDNKNV